MMIDAVKIVGMRGVEFHIFDITNVIGQGVDNSRIDAVLETKGLC